MISPNHTLKLNKETLRHLQEEHIQDVNAGAGTLATCRIVSCALPCATSYCTFKCANY
jgi:hypothetical protein